MLDLEGVSLFIFTSVTWRAIVVSAAAVIPAPRVYIVAVKKFVVVFQVRTG